MIPAKFRLIAVSADIVRAFGSDAAIWLGSAISSQDLSLNWYKESWWYCTKDQMEKQTGLTNERQESARRKLREVGVLEERRGILKRGASLATIWYSINFNALEALVCRDEPDSIAVQDGGRLPSSPANDHTSVTSSVTSGEQHATTPGSPEGSRKTRTSPEPQTVSAKLNAPSMATSAGTAGQATAAAEATPPHVAAAPPRKKRAPVPPPPAPTLEEWQAYAKEAFPWWPGLDVEKAYAHYEKLGWAFRDGRPIANWKGCARTCSTNWKSEHQAEYMNAVRFLDTAKRNAATPFGGDR